MKKLIILLFVICVISCAILSQKYFDNSKENTIVNSNNTLAIMVETGVGSGEYIESSKSFWPGDGYESFWPGDGYAYNDNLSWCENGSNLIWNEENKTLTLNSSLTDKCYIYFDLTSN